MKNGPIEGANGTKRWYLNNQLHREDGPAVEHADGHKWWYLNNQLHREDGPAVERANGTKKWFLNNQRLTPATKVTTVNSKTEDKPSPGDLVKDEINNLLLITAVVGDPDQGYHLALLK